MDRRRFVPASEGLEQRALLASNSGLGSLFGLQTTTNVNVPVTYQEKELRVEHLEYYLEKIRPGRYLPKTEMKEITDDLFQLISKIHKPREFTLNNYNYGLRPIVNKQSITAKDADIMNQGFGTVLASAKASPSLTSSLQSAVYQLVTQVDTASPQPAYLASNDYSLILQTALAVGRPMPSPTLPQIAKNEGIQADVDHIKTPLKHPSFVGTYHFHTHIQVVTPGGEIVGTVNCRPNNRYRVTVQTPLSPGVYYFRIRAYDDAGNLSNVSRLFAVKVVPMKHHPKT